MPKCETSDCRSGANNHLTTRGHRPPDNGTTTRSVVSNIVGAVLTLVVIAVVIAGFVYALMQPRWSERSIAAVNGAVDSSTLAVTGQSQQCGSDGS